MFKIIPSQNFRHIPWKNGQGKTIELAINESGTLDDFDWRLSIATVEKDGQFSDFTGYTRNLVLIKGNGLQLEHSSSQIDRLNRLLQLSTFDGGNKTIAKLINGPITDFNLMTKTSRINGRLKTYSENTQIELEGAQICFIYALSGELNIYLDLPCSNSPSNRQIPQKSTIPPGELAKLTNLQSNQVVITGAAFILIYLDNT